MKLESERMLKRMIGKQNAKAKMIEQKMVDRSKRAEEMKRRADKKLKESQVVLSGVTPNVNVQDVCTDATL